MTVVGLVIFAAAPLVFALKTSPLDAQTGPWDAKDFVGVHGLCAFA